MTSCWKKIIVVSAIVVGVFVAAKAEAATLSVTPQFREFNDKETLVVDVRLNSEHEIVNAVQATIVYPANMLEVVEMSRGGSFLTLWPEEPQNNKNAGTILLAGGIPHGSLVIDGRVVRLIFRTKAVGDLEIGFDKNATSVHLNDGQGTPANLTLTSGLYKITPATFVSLTSPTHPDENEWYHNNAPIFQWPAREEAEYSYVLTEDPTKLPDNVRESTRGEMAYTNLSDGIYYFILKEKTAEKEWAVAGKRRVMIDATPPLPVQSNLGRDSSMFNNRYFLAFSTTDVTSGLAYYDVIEGDKTFHGVTSPYQLNDQSPTKVITVRAVDKAGNKTETPLNSTLPPATRRSSSTSLPFIAGIVVVAVVAFFLMRRRFKTRSK